MQRTTCLIAALIAAVATITQADYYVARNGANTHTHPFTDWATAASNIQDAVNAATNSSIVWVEAGTYTTPTSAVTYLGTTNVVYINKELDLRGASGNAADVIIDGESTNRGVAAVYSIGNELTLANVTVSNCFATNRGGGVFIQSQYAQQSLLNCVITDNRVGPGAGNSQGGGLFAWRDGNPFQLFVSNCVFRNNQALSADALLIYGEGGGIYLSATKTTGGGWIMDTLIENNSARGGGGLQCRSLGSLGMNMTNCIVRYNTAAPAVNAGYGGGGLHFYYGAGSLWNCLVYNNFTPAYGGGIYNQKSGPLYVYNCTIVSNEVNSGFGGGIHGRQDTDSVIVYNSIVYSNDADDIWVGGGGTTYVSYCCIDTDNVDSAIALLGGNITNEPQFVDFAGKNFRLSRTSPCLNMGSNDLSWMSTTLDLDGYPRIDRNVGIVDMGAYEHVYFGSTITIQ